MNNADIQAITWFTLPRLKGKLKSLGEQPFVILSAEGPYNFSD